MPSPLAVNTAKAIVKQLQLTQLEAERRIADIVDLQVGDAIIGALTDYHTPQRNEVGRGAESEVSQ